MSEYLRYEIKNIESLRIADDSTSQNGQTKTLCYIPGSTIRGLVINALNRLEDFENIKKSLFSTEVRYLNAYPCYNGKELLPSLKGFYEDKTMADGSKEIQNVVINGDFSEGYKRASLGHYCYIQDDCIYYYSVDTSSDMKIKMNVENVEDRNVFRNEYIVPEQTFVGYIAVDNSELKEKIKSVFHGQIILGNGRSSGMGKCKVCSCQYTDSVPYSEYKVLEDLTGECYMILLSNTTMRNKNGEYCGIDIETLEKMLGVEDMKIAYCATSTVTVRGYNRIWGMKVPSVVMYEQGSVFHLTFNGIASIEKMNQIMDNGIGIRKNEGFGRVLFFKNYEKVHSKLAGQALSVNEDKTGIILHAEDTSVLKIAAKGYYQQILKMQIDKYVLEHPIQKGKISNSQLGIIESFTSAYQYDPEEGIRFIHLYLEHANKKEEKNNTHKIRNSVKEITHFVNHILESDLEDLLMDNTKNNKVMGINKKELLSDNEVQKIKLGLITSMIRYDNKKEVE